MGKSTATIPFLLLLLGHAVMAQPAGGDEISPDGYLGEVIVTGTREARERRAAAATTGVISGEAIENLKPATAPEIMERVSGVHVNWLGGDHHGTSIRQPISFDPVYLYLENGVPIRSAGFFNVNSLIEMNVPQAARLEITKGPGTALYGSDAVAGVINLITPEPPDTASATLSLEGGEYGWVRGMASLGGRAGHHGIRADINVTREEGWRDSTNYGRQLGTLNWTVDGERWHAETVLSAGHVDQQSSGSNLTRQAFENTPKVNFVPFAVREIYFARLATHLERRIAAGSIKITPFLRYNEVTLLPAFALGFDPHIERTENGSAGVQLSFSRGRSDRNMQWLAGIDIDRSWGDRLENSLDVERTGDFFTGFSEDAVIYDYDVNFLSLSPYAHVDWQPNGRLHLSAGLRFDYIRYDYKNGLTVVADADAPHKRPPSQAVDFDHLSPKFGATYDIRDWLNAYVSYRHAFRVPTESQLFRPGRSKASTDLIPVKADNIELGLRGTLAGRANFQAAYYRLIKRDDILAFNNTETSVRTNLNAGKTLHHGVELSVQVAVNDEISIAGVYARNEHEFKNWRPDTETDFTGNELQRAPRDVGNLRLRYAPRWLNGGRLEAEWQHLGSYFMDDENTIKYQGHDLIHLRGNYFPVSGLEIFARLHNLTDKRYAVLARFTRFTGEQLKPGLPRTLYGGVAYRF